MTVNHHATYLVLLSVLVYYVSCQDVNEIKDELEKKLGDIPGLEGFNSSSLPKVEDVEKIFKEKCEKNGADPDTVDQIKSQQDGLRGCIEQYVNSTVVETELAEAKKTGSMDEVFGKYCGKYPEIHKCVENVTESIKMCMDDNEKDALNTSLRILGELKEFLCFKDGDRIAMFVAEGGVECLEEKKEQIQNCVNATLGRRIPTDLSVTSLPSFVFSDRDCTDFDTIRKCVNVELEKCKESTPANIIDAFFKFLKKHMPCKNTGVLSASVGESKGSSSSVFYTSIPLLITSIIYIFMV